ncbi:MAG TPA: glycosyltransferase family 4 protein [Gaiellaceae bacterium]
MKRRVLMVGRTRYALPLEQSLRRKFDALRDRFELRVLGSGPVGDETFSLHPSGPLDGLRYHAGLPLRVAGELRRRPADAILVQGPHEAALVLAGRRLAGSRARVIVDVHGDWRTATRLYGSPARRALDPLADRLAAWALRRADAVRTVSDYTSGLVRELGVEPAATFPAYMDLEPFLGPPAPLPGRPVALFVGVLELYKNVDGLAEAWREVAPRVPEATLRIVGRGSRREVVERLVQDLPGRTRWDERLTPEEVARALDEASLVVLPSRSEGMGRVIVEALLRGRPVLGSRVGGIRDLVRDGENGLLVEPGRLAPALERALSDRDLLERLAANARGSVEPWLATPDDFAERVRELVG